MKETTTLAAPVDERRPADAREAPETLLQNELDDLCLEDPECALNEPQELLAAPKPKPLVRLAPHAKLIPELDALWLALQSRARRPAPLPRTLWVAHWAPKEGGTTVATTLALRASELQPEFAFCLVDLDVHEAGLTRLCGLNRQSGLSNLLREETPIETAITGTQRPNLSILSVGYPKLTSQEISLLQSGHEWIRTLQGEFDGVIVDLPAMRDDAEWMRGNVEIGEWLLVARAGVAQRSQMEPWLRTLRRARADIAGVVLNGCFPSTLTKLFQ